MRLALYQIQRQLPGRAISALTGLTFIGFAVWRSGSAPINAVIFAMLGVCLFAASRIILFLDAFHHKRFAQTFCETRQTLEQLLALSPEHLGHHPQLIARAREFLARHSATWPDQIPDSPQVPTMRMGMDCVTAWKDLVRHYTAMQEALVELRGIGPAEKIPMDERDDWDQAIRDLEEATAPTLPEPLKLPALQYTAQRWEEGARNAKQLAKDLRERIKSEVI